LKNKNSLISIEYPKAAPANHNQYFGRDTRVCLAIFHKQTNKQKQIFVFLFVCENKERQTKKLPQLNWTSSGQAATKTERNEFLFLINFPEFSETFAILRNIECSRKSSENPSCSLTPISLNLSPLNHFQTL
jgi:hypothetical protein